MGVRFLTRGPLGAFVVCWALGVAPPQIVSAAGAARITSVSFTGSQALPVITIRGHGFGAKPSPNPAYQPVGHPLCPLAPPTGNLARYGLDYGTHLFLQDSTPQPTQPTWSAGRYRPSVGELDCVGVSVAKYTATTVVFRLGGAYPHYPGARETYRLVPGDLYVVGVNGAHATGHVAYQ